MERTGGVPCHMPAGRPGHLRETLAKRKRKKRSKLLDFVAYLGLRTFAMFVHMFSWEANYRTARWVGDLMYRFDRRHRQRGLAHLRKSFPDWPQDKLHRVCRASMRNLAYLGVEFLFTTRLITPGRWRRHITLTNQQENLHLLLAHETPLIYVAGHFGNWEVVGYAMAALGFPVYAVARRLDNPYVDRYVMGVREARGMTVLDKRGASARLEGILCARGNVCFVADQDAGRKGAFVDFFGRKASTYKAVALMAMRHRAPVIVGYGRRLDEEYHFEIGIGRVIHPHEWADKDNPMLWITQEYTRALEEVIRTAPEQYLWVHRRWKHRPRGEPAAPDGVA